MAIEAQLADGRILEFPDGTDQAVIQSTVKRLIAESAPKQAAVPQDSGFAVSDPMGSALPSAIAEAPVPKKQSVLEGAQMPAPLPTEDKMLNPGFVSAIQAQLNALPEEKRQAALAKMTQRPDAYGRAAKVIAGRYAALDEAQKTQVPTMRRLDPRLEAQTERFMEQGMEPEAARNLAQQQAMTGEFRPDLQQVRPDIEGEIADQEAARQREALKDAGFFGRVGAETKAQYEQAGLGLMNVFADITGDKQMQQDVAGATRMVAAGQQAIPKGTGVFERSAQGAISSLAGQAPMIAASMVMGTPAPVLLQAGVQQFGNAYGEARAAGQSPEAAAARAIPMAAAEVFFERFGMEKAMAGLRKFVAEATKNGEKITGNQIAEYIGKAVAKEIPSEMATTLTQYGVDIVPGVGLNRNPSVTDLYQQLEETLRQTVIQAGVQSGVTLGTAKGLEKLSSALTPERTPYERDRSYEGRALLEAMARGFLTPERGSKVAPPPAKPTAEAPAPAPAPAPKADREERLAALTAEIESTGIPEDDAREQAEQMLAAQEDQEQKKLAPRIIELTQEYVDAGMEPQEANKLAIEQAKEEAQADEQAQREGAVGAAQPVSTTTGAGAGMARQPGAMPAPARAGVLEPSGVVPAGQDVAGTAAGEGAQPTALTPERIAELSDTLDAMVFRGQGLNLFQAAKLKEQLKNPDTQQQAVRAIEEKLVETQQQFAVQPQTPVGGAAAPVTEAPKPKRGRPAVLTEEEKLQRAEAKKPAQAAKARVERSLARLTKTLDDLATPPVEDDFETDEDYQAALNEHKGKRREAIKELLLLQADPSIRGTKVGERVKAALARPDITAKEKADLQAGIDAQKRAAAAIQSERPSASRVSKGKADTAFSKFTNGVQALSHIIKTGNDFQKMLGKRLRGFVTNVRFVVIEEGQELPAQLQTPKNARQWERSIALYIENYKTGDRVIYVRGKSFGDDQGVNNITILHELLHAATNRKVALAISDIQRGVQDSPNIRAAQDLLRTMNSAIQTYNEMARSGQLSKEMVAIARSGEALTDPREFIAYGMTDPEFQKFLMKAKGYEEDTSYFNRFVRGIRELFGMDEDTTNAFTDLIIATDSILRSRAPKTEISGEAVSPTAKGEPLPVEQVLRALPPVLVARGSKTPSLKRRIDALRRRRQAGQMTDAQFAEEVDYIAEAVEEAKYQKVIPKRQRGVDYIRERILNAKRNGWISEEAADLAEWFLKQNPALADDLGISFTGKGKSGVGGQYLDASRVAQIIKEGGNTGTIVHEVLHHLERMMPEPVRNALRKEWYRQFLKAQDKASDNAQKKFFELLNKYHSDDGRLTDFTAATDMLREGAVPIEFYQYVNPSEFWAVNGTRIVEGKFAAVQGTVLTKLKTWLGAVGQKLRALFGLSSDAPVIRALESLAEADGKFVTNRMLQEEGVYQSVGAEQPKTPESVKEAGRTQKELDRAVKVANFKFEESKNGEEYAKAVSALQMMQDPRKVVPAIRDLYNRMNVGAREALVRVMTTDFLTEVASDNVPELENTYKLLQKMSGMTQTFLKAAGDLTNDIARAYRKDPSLRAKLDRLTHMATLAEYDPADTTQKIRNKNLDEQYADLGPEGQRVYNRIKKHYETLSNYFSKLLDDQITQSGLPMAEQANLIKKIRAIYETGTKITPYFPLVRRGDYWLSIGKGDTRKFFMYETMGERDRAMRGFADEKVKQKPGESAAAFEKRRAANLEELLGDEDFVIGNDISSLRRSTIGSSQLLTGVFTEIDKASTGTDFTPEAKEQLKDAVYQIYLQTMPEQSFRKQFIHREGFAGFRTDLLRNVADTTTKMATQLARIKYAPLLRNSLSQARESIKNRTLYEPYVASFERRVSDALSAGKPSLAERIAGTLNKFSFIYYLGGISSAMLQPLSLFQTGIPVLMKYGVGNAYTEMARMLKVWQEFGVMHKNADGTYSWAAPSIENVVRSADERRAIKDMLGRDITTSTYARDALDYKAKPTDKIPSPKVQFAKDTVDALVLGGLMHSSERLSREAMFLAAYRLNRKAGKDHDTAVDNAVTDTNEALGNYGEYSRPEFMKGAPGKILTQFMMYPVHVTLFMGKNFVEMVKPMNGRTRWEATKKFFGTMGHTWVLGGAVGLWGFSTVMGLLGAMWNSLKDDDWPEDVKNMSYELWWRTVWLKEQLGGTKIAGVDLADIVERGPINAITGVDISSRTSLNNMWMRDTKETATVRESAMALALEKAGPAANMIVSQVEAIEAFIQGDYKKGALKASPAGFRNFINTYHYWKEGAKDNKGAQILSRDAFTTGELIFQAVGFRSDLLANTQYVTFKVIGLEQKINNQRTLIMNQLDRAYRQRDFKAYREYYDDMQKFNSKYPTYEITTDNLVESLERRQEQRAKSWRGVVPTEKNIGPFSKALMPSRKAATEREKKNQEE